MWKIGDTYMGALEDETIFYGIHGHWKLLDGGKDPAATILALAEGAERNGGKLIRPPMDFAVDIQIADYIRANHHWNRVEPILLIGYDMVSRIKR